MAIFENSIFGECTFVVSSYKILHGIALFHGCIDGFLGKKEYAAMPDTRFTTKLQQLLCLECSIWHIFLRKSLTDSITARFLRSILSESSIRLLVLEFFFLFCNQLDAIFLKLAG